MPVLARNPNYPLAKMRVYLEEYPECVKYMYQPDWYDKGWVLVGEPVFESLAGLILFGHSTATPNYWEKLNIVLTAASLGTVEERR